MGIFVHPWDMQLDGRMQQYWLPWLMGEYTRSHGLLVGQYTGSNMLVAMARG